MQEEKDLLLREVAATFESDYLFTERHDREGYIDCSLIAKREGIPREIRFCLWGKMFAEQGLPVTVVLDRGKIKGFKTKQEAVLWLMIQGVPGEIKRVKEI